MLRYVAVGAARLHVLGMVPHDAGAAQRIGATLASLAPERVEVAMSVAEWDALLADPARLTPYEARLYDLLVPLGLCPVAPNAAYAAVARWAVENGRTVQPVLSTEPPLLPKGRKGLKGLDKLLKQEGFDAASPEAAAARLRDLYVARLPDLAAPLAVRWAETAKRVAARARADPRRTVVVAPEPFAAEMADRLRNASASKRP
ncbi:MAG: hypothetical protein ACPGQL_01865 [Thermoplasmatota archaeon]